MQPRSVFSDGVVAALPIAAAFAILLARWLPVHFEYVPNDLGIVSLTTLARYPAQQEMFWYAYALAVCALGTWGLARLFRRTAAPIASIAWAEMAGGAGLLAVLWLPVFVGAVGWALSTGGAFWILSAGGTRPSGPVAIESLPAPRARSPRRSEAPQRRRRWKPTSAASPYANPDPTLERPALRNAASALTLIRNWKGVPDAARGAEAK